MNAVGPVQSHVNFAKDPLRLYFDESRKKIKFFFYIYISLQPFHTLFWSFSAITFDSRHHDVTSVERFDNQWQVYSWRRLTTSSHD